MVTCSPPRPLNTPGRRLARSLRLLVAPDRLPLTIILLGGLLRVAQYLFNRSLWIDEAAVALIIRERSIPQLFDPLDYNQAAPVGFLVLVKLAALAFGYNEYALRLTPLVCGLAALPLFYLTARRFIRPPAVPIALGLFALAESLVYYSSELKQYSGDVTAALALYLWAFLPLTRPVTPLKALVAGLTGAIIIWFSHPAAFILAGIGTVLVVRNLYGRAWKTLGWLVLTGGLWGVSFLIFYLVSVQAATANQGLLDFHNVFFMPLPPFTPANLTWLVTNFFFIFENPGSLGMAGPGILGCLVGGVYYYKGNNLLFWALILPFGYILLASGLHKYSFGGRLVLFLLPALFFLIAEGIVVLREATRNSFPAAGLILVVLLFSQPAAGALGAVGVPRTKEEIRPVLSYYQANRQPGDQLYVYYGADTAFRYYKAELGLPPDCCIMGIDSRDDWNKYPADLDKLRGKPRVWVMISHIWEDENIFFKYYLDSIGKKLDNPETTGSIIYLYDLSNK